MGYPALMVLNDDEILLSSQLGIFWSPEVSHHASVRALCSYAGALSMTIAATRPSTLTFGMYTTGTCS